jgi:O-antigen ligase
VSPAPAIAPSIAVPARRELLPVLAYPVLGVVALAVGVQLGRPVLALGLLAAVIAVPFLLVRPVACLVLLTVVEMANLSGVADQNGVPGVYLASLALGAAAVVIAVRRGQLRPAWSPVFLTGALFVAVQLVAGTFGADPTASLAVVEANAKGLVWLVVVTLLMLCSPTAPGTAARAVVATLTALALLTLVQQFVLHNATTFGGLANVPLGADIGAATARHAGPQADVNFWGRLLIMGLPFAFALARLARGRLRRTGWAAAGLVLVGGIVITGSRGALLAGFGAVVLWALMTGGRARRALLLTPLLAVLAVLTPGVGSRLSTLLELTGPSGVAAVDPSLVGRVDAQKVALQVLVDHPVLGVGPGQFQTVEPGYLRRLGLDTIVLAPHNSYLEAAAETGIAGLAAWLLLLGSAVVVALRVRRLLADAGQLRGVADATVAALAAWAVASVFLHLATFRSLLLVVAIGAALEVHAQREFPRWIPAGAWDPTSPQPRRSPSVVRRWALTAAAALVVLAAGLAALGLRDGGGSVATAGVQLVAVSSGTRQPTGYELDVLTRPDLIRTYATLVEGTAQDPAVRSALGLPAGALDGLAVTVTNKPPSGLISIVVAGPDAATDRRVAEALRDRSMQELDRLGGLYGAQAVAQTSVTASSSTVPAGGLAVLALACAVGVLAWLLVRRRAAGPAAQGRAVAQPGRHTEAATAAAASTP